MMGFRAPPVLRAAIVKWAENQKDQPTLSEATRRIVEQALGIATEAKQSSPAAAIRAKELATKVIEKITDPPFRQKSRPSADDGSPRDLLNSTPHGSISRRRPNESPAIDDAPRSADFMPGYDSRTDLIDIAPVTK